MARGEKKKIVVKKRFPVTRFAFDEGLEEDFNNRKPEQGVTHGSVKNGGIVYDIDDLLPLEEYLVEDEQIPNTGSIDESMLCWKYINLMSNKPIRDTRLLTSEWEYYPINIHPENNSVCFEHKLVDGNATVNSITFKYYNLFTKSIKYEQFYLDNLLHETGGNIDTWNNTDWTIKYFDRGVFPFVKWGISNIDISGVIKNKTVNTNNIGMIFVASDNDIPVNENDGSHQGRSGEHMLGYFPGKDVSKINIKAFPTQNTKYDSDNHVTSKAQLANIFKSSIDDAMKSLNNTLVRGLYNSVKNAYRIKPIFFLKTEKFIKYRVSLPFKVLHNLEGAKKSFLFNPGDDAISNEDTYKVSYFNYTTIKPNENNGDDVIVYAPVQKLRDVIEEVTQEDINNGFYLKFFGFSENDIPDSEYKLSYTYSSIDGDLYYEYPDTFNRSNIVSDSFNLATPDLGYKFYYDISNEVECAHFVIEESTPIEIPFNQNMTMTLDDHLGGLYAITCNYGFNGVPTAYTALSDHLGLTFDGTPRMDISSTNTIMMEPNTYINEISINIFQTSGQNTDKKILISGYIPGSYQLEERVGYLNSSNNYDLTLIFKFTKDIKLTEGYKIISSFAIKLSYN